MIVLLILMEAARAVPAILPVIDRNTEFGPNPPAVKLPDGSPSPRIAGDTPGSPSALMREISLDWSLATKVPVSDFPFWKWRVTPPAPSSKI
jgi:hypothetical protein